MCAAAHGLTHTYVLTKRDHEVQSHHSIYTHCLQNCLPNDDNRGLVTILTEWKVLTKGPVLLVVISLEK